MVGATGATPDKQQALCQIKSNFANLVHQADLQVNGKTIEPTNPLVNVRDINNYHQPIGKRARH